MFNHMHPFTQNNNNLFNKDIEVELELTLEDIYNGIVKNISFNKNEKCNKCIDNKLIICNNCNGNGKCIQIIHIGPYIQHIECKCNNCLGKGKYRYKNFNCIICKGSNVISMRKTVQIKIPKGIMSNHKILIKKEWNGWVISEF